MHRQTANVIGRKVVFLRHQHEWTQDDLVGKLQARGFCITRCVIANIETGRSAVTDLQIFALAEIFDVEPGLFFPPRRGLNGSFPGLSRPPFTRRRKRLRHRPAPG